MQYPEANRVLERAALIPGDQALHGRALAALEAQQYGMAVQSLEKYLKQIQFSNASSHTHIALARAYWGNRQRKDAMNLCHHLMQTGDLATRRWAQRFIAATKTHPKAHDPLVAENRLRNQKAVLSVDVTDKILIVAVHLSIYGGLMLMPLLPAGFWQELLQSLVQQGMVPQHLFQPLGMTLLPVLLPLGLFFIPKDKVLKAHGREVLSYWMTMLLLVVIPLVGTGWLSQVQALLSHVPIVLNLLKLVRIGVGVSYLLSPGVAIAWLFLKPNSFFSYPFILRFF